MGCYDGCGGFFVWLWIISYIFSKFISMDTVAEGYPGSPDAQSTVEAVKDGLANLHATLDADQDGALSLDDTVKHVDTVYQALDADGDGALSYTDLRDTVSTALDANGDQHRDAHPGDTVFLEGNGRQTHGDFPDAGTRTLRPS